MDGTSFYANYNIICLDISIHVDEIMVYVDEGTINVDASIMYVDLSMVYVVESIIHVDDICLKCGTNALPCEPVTVIKYLVLQSYIARR